MLRRLLLTVPAALLAASATLAPGSAPPSEGVPAVIHREATAVTPSDARLKKNIQPLVHSLARLLALRGVEFEYADPAAIGQRPGRYRGMIAQEVEKVFPDWVVADEKGDKSLHIIGFEALTVESLRELAQTDSSLRAQIASLEQEVDTLGAENAALRSELAHLAEELGDLSDRVEAIEKTTGGGDD